jgi:tRNA (guanine-N7-)-methyltransferase
MPGATAGKIVLVNPTATIRTYHPRARRMSGRHHEALTRLWPTYGVTVDGTPLDLPVLFGRDAPLVLEIGSGMGDATAAMAAADTDRDYLAVEVHTPGIANLLALVEDRRLANVRVARGDALELLGRMLPPGRLDAVHVFFPDPWPKVRHHKRRLLQPTHVPVLRAALRPGGVLHCATDWEPYAAAMLRALSADPELANLHDGYAPRPTHRPRTRFERRAERAGRPVFDLLFRRAGG